MAFVKRMAELVETTAHDCSAMGDALVAHFDAHPDLTKFLREHKGTPEHVAWLQKNERAFAADSERLERMAGCLSNDKVSATLAAYR